MTHSNAIPHKLVGVARPESEGFSAGEGTGIQAYVLSQTEITNLINSRAAGVRVVRY